MRRHAVGSASSSSASSGVLSMNRTMYFTASRIVQPIEASR